METRFKFVITLKSNFNLIVNFDNVWEPKLFPGNITYSPLRVMDRLLKFGFDACDTGFIRCPSFAISKYKLNF